MGKAPLTKLQLKQLHADVTNIRAAALRKNITLDDWDEKRELEAAKTYFDLGCWLFYYSRRVGLTGRDGLNDRIQCLKHLFLAGFNNPGYRFFTIFDFGERHFDTTCEMGDADQVIQGLRDLIPADSTGQIARGFGYFGWPISLTDNAQASFA
jgi:hypothetical protein